MGYVAPAAENKEHGHLYGVVSSFHPSSPPSASQVSSSISNEEVFILCLRYTSKIIYYWFSAHRMSHSHISVPLSHPQNLPTEVWERCWSYCHNRRLRRLVLVCRLFRDICHPLLFHKQTFRAPYTEDITPHNWMHFCAHIVSTGLSTPACPR
jgi:hypothetical protein